jgi:hypothetical protein
MIAQNGLSRITLAGGELKETFYFSMSLFLKHRMSPLFSQELGYLTLQRIGRAERPKRLTRE